MSRHPPALPPSGWAPFWLHPVSCPRVSVAPKGSSLEGVLMALWKPQPCRTRRLLEAPCSWKDSPTPSSVRAQVFGSIQPSCRVQALPPKRGWYQHRMLVQCQRDPDVLRLLCLRQRQSCEGHPWRVWPCAASWYGLPAGGTSHRLSCVPSAGTHSPSPLLPYARWDPSACHLALPDSCFRAGFGHNRQFRGAGTMPRVGAPCWLPERLLHGCWKPQTP